MRKKTYKAVVQSLPLASNENESGETTNSKIQKVTQFQRYIVFVINRVCLRRITTTETTKDTTNSKNHTYRSGKYQITGQVKNKHTLTQTHKIDEQAKSSKQTY